jgi:microcystin-dependent protein
MPRNGSGVYSLPAGYLATTGQSATATQHNTPLEDLASEITASLPTAGTKAMSGNLQMGSNKITGMADGSATTDGATVANINTSLAAYMPAGVVVPYAGTSEPTGWLLCIGQAVSRTTYAALFSAIGTAHGVGDGSTTFNLPDLRGRVVAGQDDMGGSSANRLTGLSGGVDGDAFGSVGGAETVTMARANLPNDTVTTTSNGDHSHAYFNMTSLGISGGSGGAREVFEISATSTSTNGAHTHTIALNGGVTQTAMNNVQPTIILNYIIRT